MTLQDMAEKCDNCRCENVDVLKPLTVDKEKDSFETWAKAVKEQTKLNRTKLKGEKDVYKQ